MQAAEGPGQVYRDQRDARRQRAAEVGRVQERLAWLRLVVFLAAVVLAWGAFTDRWRALWLVVPFLLFVALMRWHERVIRRRRRVERAVTFYDAGLDRLAERWAGRGLTGVEYLDPAHPYAADLDLFGQGSLFELLCRARTRPGERRLADWLLEPATPQVIRDRQRVVEELRPRLDLREDLAVLGEEIGHGVDPRELLEWAADAPVLTGRWPPWVALLLGSCNLVTLCAWLATQLGADAGTWAGPRVSVVPFALSALASGLFVLLYRRRVDQVLSRVDRPEQELQLLALLLQRVERERFEAPLLIELQRQLQTTGAAPSRRIARLAAIVETQRSFFPPLAHLLLLPPQLAWAMERWRRASGPELPGWIAVVGTLEALCSLAGQAFERPDDPFPTVVEGPACLAGVAVGHPLIAASVSVRNDVTLGHGLQLLLVSGSNMSGKSTFLRTVGLNAVLAQAGATVRAESLQLSPLTIGACMRVQDSLQHGLSHFYAEIQRLKALVDLIDGRRPLLFLLDEILHGTNSHDRRVGAEALIGGLLAQGSLGLVTTHDLALAEIAARLGPRAANVHFEDRLDHDRIVFDYKLRQGVVQKSNALGLMRAIGLRV